MLTTCCVSEKRQVLFSATAVEVLDDDEEPVLGTDYKADKVGSRTRSDHLRQYVSQAKSMTWQCPFFSVFL